MALPSIPSVPGASGASDAPITYNDLQAKYDDFAFPKAEILLNKKPLVAANGAHMVVNDIRVELSSCFEASVSSFRIYNVFDTKLGKFRFDDLKSQLFMGAPVTISLGYLETVEPVFVGFVAGVAFGFQPDDLPYIEVSAMDVKSIMMGGTYSYQLTSKTYGEAVSEVFKRTGYEKLKTMGGITALSISDTPDKKTSPAASPGGSGVSAGQQKASAETIEMVSESDYEFVVKAAKKFNFEFFVDRGTVRFRKAKSETSPLAKIGVGSGIVSFHVEYSLTGLVGKIEARAMDAGQGQIISSSKTRSGTISTSGKADGLIGKATKVYIDPTITSKEQADARVDSLMEQMSYRLGSLEADCVGIPDLVPGRFVTISGMGAPADNNFYITTVTHEFMSEGGYHTKLVGCASEMKPDGLSSVLGGVGLPKL